MSIRFRLGPFTFGRTGARFSLWGRGSGVSIPLSRKGRSFGKISFGPFSWFFGGASTAPTATCDDNDVAAEKELGGLGSYEDAAIMALRSDEQLLMKLRRYGVPWRGVQECLKVGLPENLADRDSIAYGLVPRAMDAVFGKQEAAWKTERRPSKSGNGYTTWIVII